MTPCWRVTAYFDELPSPVAEQILRIEASTPGLAVAAAWRVLRRGPLKKRHISKGTFRVVRENGGAA